MANGRNTKMTSASATIARIENQGSSLALAHAAPRRTTAPTTTLTASHATTSSKVPRLANFSFTLIAIYRSD